MARFVAPGTPGTGTTPLLAQLDEDVCHISTGTRGRFPAWPFLSYSIGEGIKLSLPRNGLQLKIKELASEANGVRMTCVLERVDDRNALGFWRLPAPITIQFASSTNNRIAGGTIHTILFLSDDFINWAGRRRLYLRGDAKFKPIGFGRIEEDVWIRPPQGAQYVRFELMEGFATEFVQLPLEARMFEADERK